ncbi:MAG: tripartite tricarboxylate transporter substrate binding protein [Ramlibacter sp.]|nr:tripartite tricarboxylate transporter substrate binding protein [Ramlibacter sp.]
MDTEDKRRHGGPAQRSRARVAAVLGLGLAGWPLLSRSQAYPAKPIKLVVTAGAGGINDTLARMISVPLGDALGQPVIVENKAGAGGMVGAGIVANAPPDGYTLMIAASSVFSTNKHLMPHLTFDPDKKFVPIAQVARTHNVVVVSPALKVDSIQGLIRYGRENPGRLNYASAGIGGSLHLAAELFAHMAGIQMKHIPYKASPPAHADLLAGQIDVIFDGIIVAKSLIDSGKVKALAVTSKERTPQFPDVPTVHESGLPGYEVYGWFGLAAPAATPGHVVERLNREVVRVLRMPAVRDQMLLQGAQPVGDSRSQFQAFIRSESDKWGKVIRAANIKMD